MSKSWLKQASSEIQRDKITRIEKVSNAAENSSVDGCNTLYVCGLMSSQRKLLIWSNIVCGMHVQVKPDSLKN